VPLDVPCRCARTAGGAIGREALDAGTVASGASIKAGEALPRDARGARCPRRAAPLDMPCRCVGTDAGGAIGRETLDCRRSAIRWRAARPRLRGRPQPRSAPLRVFCYPPRYPHAFLHLVDCLKCLFCRVILNNDPKWWPMECRCYRLRAPLPRQRRSASAGLRWCGATVRRDPERN
jgi:hypothetical protein